MCVMQRRRRSRAGQGLTHDALAFLRLIGCIQRDGQGMGCNVVVGGKCGETTVVRHRFGFAAQSRVGRHVQRRQVIVQLAAVGPGCRNLECRGRLAGVQVMANQQNCGSRVARHALDCTLQ